MYANTLRVILSLKNMKPAELARLAGITRQAVSKWFNASKQINAEWITITKVAGALQIAPSILSKDLFQSLSAENKLTYHSLLLWDHLFDSIESFAIALTKKDAKAVGRYVQVFGIFAAEKIFGKWVFKKFRQYSPYIHPVRRRELEKLCQTLQELALI